MHPLRTLRALPIMLVLLSGLCAAQDEAPMDHGTMDRESADAMPGHGDATHGDHNPKFGGLVLMYGILHFEIVARPEGAIQLHLSDGMRTPMPATTVSDVTVEVEREGGRYEGIPMAISEAGDYWQGNSDDTLDDREATTLHLAFVAFGEPYIYALPLAAVQPEQTSRARDGMHYAALGATDHAR